MERTPLVSVIMPVYNTAEYLDEAIESILVQTLEDFEFIIIDDGSTDGSAKILDGYAQTNARVKVIHQENRGIVASLNRGLGLARGRYVARMDSDDISLPDRLARQVAFMDCHPEVGICGTACRMFGDSSGVTLPKTESADIKSWLLFGPCMAHPTVMMRRDLVIEHKLYYDPEFEKAEDYELWLRFSEYCEFANIPEPLLLYRVRREQITSKFRSVNSRLTGLVHRLALRRLGFEPTDEELELHLSIHKADYPTSREYVERVEAWLIKLYKENRKSRALESDALARSLYDCWDYLFRFESKLGLWMWRRFHSSRLSVAAKRTRRPSAFSTALFITRHYTSRLLEMSSFGRLFKQYVRVFGNGEWKIAQRTEQRG